MIAPPIISEKDQQILANRIALYDQKSGPRVGDFLKLTDGTYQRFTYLWNTSIQAGASAESAGFYLSEGYISYSGGLNQGVELADLVQSKETKEGEIWFFHNSEVQAHNAVNFQITFRVFELKDGANATGLWHPYGGQF